MNKGVMTLLLAAGVGSVFFIGNGPHTDKKNTDLTSALSSSKKARSVLSANIEYEAGAAKAIDKPEALNLADEKSEAVTSACVRSGFVQTRDVSGRHQIAIEGLAPVKKNAHIPVYILEGKVDGSAFKLKIPQASLKDATDTLVLVVTDLASGTVQQTPFIYGEDLKDTSKRDVLNYYTDQPDNYDFSQTRILLPGESAD